MTTLLATIFVLGVLVFLHEFGHFIVAKIVGVRVNRFSLGFPPRLIGKKIGETDYCISAIPLGGYVKLAGMIDESLDKTPLRGEPWEFQSKPWLYRLGVILAGPLSNYLVAILLFAGLVLTKGIGYVKDTTVGEVISEYPAEKAGIRVGDRIVAINGQPVTRWEDMTEIIHSRPNQEVTVEWERDGQKFVAVIHTRAQKAPVDGDIREIGLIGIGPKVYTRKVGLFSAIGYGAKRTVYLTKLIYVSLKKIITGTESIRSLGGPLIIAKLAGESARTGWDSVFALMAFLSLNFAILNLLPIPALDGGHMLFLIIEGIIRRPVPTKVKMIIQQIGMVIIFALIILVLFNDIRNVFLKK